MLLYFTLEDKWWVEELSQPLLDGSVLALPRLSSQYTTDTNNDDTQMQNVLPLYEAHRSEESFGFHPKMSNYSE